MLIKKIISSVVFIVFFSFSAICATFPNVSGKSAVVINADTNEVIFEKNKDELLSMASTTKIMTSLLAVESGRLSCVVTAKNDINCEGTSIGIKKGDSFTLETLVYAMLLESGNDAAVLTAEYLSGSEENFAELMNKKAKEIGMTSTNFVTASGLDDNEHYTTAYDMALLGAYAMRNPIFKKICSTSNYRAEYIKPEVTATYSNHNKLLNSYEGVFGIKTGFTKKSGRCLVSACKKDGATLVAVTLNAGDDWNDHKKMYDYAFETVTRNESTVNIPEEIKIYGSDESNLKIHCPAISVSTDEDDRICFKVRLKKWIYAPVTIGDEIGYVEVTVNGKTIKKESIKALENAKAVNANTEPSFSFFHKIKQLFLH